jgi:hypothetical protein
VFILQSYVPPPSAAPAGQQVIHQTIPGSVPSMVRLVNKGLSAIATMGSSVSEGQAAMATLSMREWTPSDEDINAALLQHNRHPMTVDEERQAFIQALVDDIDSVHAPQSQDGLAA